VELEPATFAEIALMSRHVRFDAPPL